MLHKKTENQLKQEAKQFREFDEAIKQFSDDIKVSEEAFTDTYRVYEARLGESTVTLTVQPLERKYSSWTKPSRPLTLKYSWDLRRLLKHTKSKRSYTNPESLVQTAEEVLREAEDKRKAKEEREAEEKEHREKLQAALDEEGLNDITAPYFGGFKRRRKWVGYGTRIRANAGLHHDTGELVHSCLVIEKAGLTPEQVREVQDLIESFGEEV